MELDGKHLTDEQLLEASGGELTAAEAGRVGEHLRACAPCRERSEAMAASLAAFAQAYREIDASPQRLHSLARAKLKARLAEAQSSRQLSARLGFSGRTLAAACALVLLCVVAIRFSYEQSRLRAAQSAIFGEVGGPVVPDANLTPGAVRSLTASQVCEAGGPPENRPPVSLQKAVFHEYGMDSASPDGYEVDHLITPALGGSDDIRNLWPESYSSEWNAHVKDELEDYLHNQVCSGKIDLTTAQREIATNWISAYQKYFHTDRPLRRSSRLVLDRDSGG